MASMTIVKGPHLLWTGVNGRKIHGIRVRALGPESEVEKRGYQREWNYNTHTVKGGGENFCIETGISAEEHARLVAELEALDAAGAQP